MVMKDTNGNGKVDQVVATFDKTLGSCSSPCTTGWTLTNVPSGGSIKSVTTSADTGSKSYLSAKNTSAGYTGTTVMSAGNTIATITLGATQSGGGTPAASSGMLKFIPVAGGTVQDAAGNKLSAEFDTASTFKLF
jgi:hypothetical protein